MAIIELQNVSKLYGFGDATTVALDDVTLSVDNGEFVAVMGPSGCGKSTLMHIIGLLDRPTHGDYMLHGRHVARLHPNQAARIRRDTIGFIFQSYNLIPRMTVLENVSLPLMYKGVSLTRRLQTASNILERVGMRDREYFLPGQLSGGQIQCAAIARALVNDPKLIIADEPTGNLDSVASRLVMELLSEIHKAGNTVIFVTHNPELTRYASRVLYMRDGAILRDEQTTIGQVAPSARRSMYFLPQKTEEDDIAGVSVLMDAIPEHEPAAPPRRPAKRRSGASAKSGKRKAKARR
ncbi:MAG TPA: ABC transporter ATP-binding protein [Candidatus Saccharimonadales bacterium]|nr:ABC transporter ATP-binding protein [Candidatus Saccharimonadales bacterium]